MPATPATPTRLPPSAVPAARVRAGARRVEPVTWPPDLALIRVLGGISPSVLEALRPVARSEDVAPLEYVKAMQLLGLPSPLSVAPYTLASTRTHVYRVWVQEGIGVSAAVHPVFRVAGLGALLAAQAEASAGEGEGEGEGEDGSSSAAVQRSSAHAWMGDGVVVRYAKGAGRLRDGSREDVPCALGAPVDALGVTFGEQRADALERGLYRLRFDGRDPAAGMRVRSARHLVSMCAVCRGPARSVCGRCGTVSYCGTAHQRAHWPEHRGACVGAAQAPVGWAEREDAGAGVAAAEAEAEGAAAAAAEEVAPTEAAGAAAEAAAEGAGGGSSRNSSRSSRSLDPPDPARPCAFCQQPATARCGRCYRVVYCCKEHQRADWGRHKLTCVQTYVL
jgi:hypothetical protein